MNPANKLTLLRGLLGLIIPVFIYFQDFFGYTMALFLFVFAVWTDYYDGILARRLGKETTFGKFMDPIADKILIIGPLVALADMGFIPLWLIFIVFIREILMMGLRSLAAAQGIIFGANKYGKSKGVIQYGILTLILLVFYLNEIYEITFMVGFIFELVLIMVMVTVITGIIVFVENIKLFGDS
jgi:CDP-diacylglycerol---glycerol-3-phosphate 3-phosphatidyltransferase